MKKLNKFLIFALLALFFHPVAAQNTIESSSEQSLQLLQENNELKSQIEAQNKSLGEINKEYANQKESLDKLIQDYHDLKLQLEVQKKSDELISFSSWASFLLTTVAVLVTVLGVVIALISFIGFRGIKAQAEAIATKAAEDQVQIKLHGIAVDEFSRLIDEGAFNKQLNSAVDMILRLEDVRVHDELDEYEKMTHSGE